MATEDPSLPDTRIEELEEEVSYLIEKRIQRQTKRIRQNIRGMHSEVLLQSYGSKDEGLVARLHYGRPGPARGSSSVLKTFLSVVSLDVHCSYIGQIPSGLPHGALLPSMSV